MKNKALLIVVALLSLFVGYYFFSSGETDEKIQYTTAKISRGDIENLVVTTGSVKAVGTVEVGSQISGQISELYVDFNSEVKTGDLLAQIDPRTYEGRLKQAEAQLEIAKANVAQQQANLLRTKGDLEEAARLFDRQKKLSKAGHISESELDSLSTALESARAQVTIAEAQVANSKASVTQADASLFQAKIDLERCTIISPVDGVVINRAIELGQTVAASMSAPILFTIAQDLHEMQVEASVDEADIGKVKMDQLVNFTVEAFPDKKFQGTVKQVRKAANELQNVVTYTVIVSADNRDESLLPGMTATVEVTTGKKENVLRVPNTALRFKPANAQTDESNPRPAMVENRIQTMKQQLNLSEDQVKAVKKIMEERMEAMRSRMQAGGFGGGAGPSTDGPSRRSFFNNEEFEKVLTDEQYAEFQRITQEQRNRPRVNRDDRPKPGTVWLLGENTKQEPIKKRVLTGLAGDEYTEIVSSDDIDGATVVVRARRTQ